MNHAGINGFTSRPNALAVTRVRDPDRLRRPPGKDHAPPGPQRMQPTGRRRCDAGVHVDQVRGRDGERDGVAGGDGGILERGKISPGRSGKLLLDLEGVHAATGQHQHREDRRVVPHAGTDVGDDLARLGGNGTDPGGVEKGLAVVDALLRVECDQRVLIEVDRIGTGRVDVAVPDHDLPWPRRQECLARYELENSLQPRIARAAGARHQLRIEAADLVEAGTPPAHRCSPCSRTRRSTASAPPLPAHF